MITLTSLLLGLVAGVCIAQLRLARATAERAISTDAARTASVVLSGEARRMVRADVRAMSAESIAVRAFRGRALVCGTTATRLLVRYSGDRLPDAAKDSILFVAPAGAPAMLLHSSTPAPGVCAAVAGESVLEWDIGGFIPPAQVALVFESGSYHLTDRALRYRIGAGGRQPLTAEALMNPGSRFTGLDDRAVRFEVSPDGLSTAGHTAFFAFQAPPP